MRFSRALEPAVGSDMWPRPERKDGRGPANRPLAGDGASQAAKRRRKDAPTNICTTLDELKALQAPMFLHPFVIEDGAEIARPRIRKDGDNACRLIELAGELANAPQGGA